ncbi:PPC domain-containing protein [Desulfobulbus sp. AH-315-M07]|nr:PPC domain-containing protein [Desulfobulbus sp. AH-315-M07]
MTLIGLVIILVYAVGKQINKRKQSPSSSATTATSTSSTTSSSSGVCSDSASGRDKSRRGATALTLDESHSGHVSCSGDSTDYYAVKVPDDGEIRISLTGLSADADLFFYRRSEPLARSSRSTINDEEIVKKVTAGEYFLGVKIQGSGSTSYELKAAFEPSGAAPSAPRPGPQQQRERERERAEQQQREREKEKRAAEREEQAAKDRKKKEQRQAAERKRAACREKWRAKCDRTCKSEARCISACMARQCK